METIKVRAFTEQEGMIYIDDLYWFEENGVHTWDGNGHYRKFKFMQSIGLLCKNGKDIYKGDIIKSKSSIGTYTIIWDNCGFKKKGNSDEISAFGKKNDSIYDIFVYKGENEKSIDYYAIEIIGNIYENPELLKPKS